MKNKWIRRLCKAGLTVILLVLLADMGLHLISHTQWFNNWVDQTIEKSLNREIKLSRIGANFRGVFVDGLEVAQPGGFAEGVFLQAGHLQVRFSLLHLLYGHVKVRRIIVSNATLRAIVHADGATNWDDLIASDTVAPDPDKETGPVPVSVSVGNIRLEQLHLMYKDEQAQRVLDVDGLTVDVNHFSLDREFLLRLYGQLHHREADFDRTVPFTLKAKLNLKQLDLPQAYVQVQAFKAFYKKSSLTLSGRVENFVNPQVDLKLDLRRFSSDSLEAIASLPVLNIPRVQATLKAKMDLDKQALRVDHFSLQAPGVEARVKGKLSYHQEPVYQASADISLVMGEIGRWFPLLAQSYQLIGTLQSELTLSDQQLSAQVYLQDVGAHLEQMGRLANVNGSVTLEEKMDFKGGKGNVKLDGKLNANPFEITLTADHTPQQIDAKLSAFAQELLVIASNPDAPAAEESQPAEPSAAAEKSWPLPPIHLVSSIKLGKADVPYFVGEDIEFSSDLEGITPDLNQAHGALHLRTGEGKIQDIYKLTNANPITKVLFLSLNVTGKVFNTLNVFGVLNSLGSGLVNVVSGGDEKKTDTPVKTQTILGPDGEALEVPVEETDKQVSGEMQYDKFDTEVNFVRGVATIKKGTFVSPTMSLRLDGTTDFNTGAIDLTVHAAPGRHEVDGMLPLSLKIDGTVDNPQGSMQLLGSVTSLVTQTVTNNVVSRNVAKGVKGIFGLFKKKEQPQEQEPQE